MVFSVIDKTACFQFCFFIKILNPLKTRFDALITAPTFRKDAQHEAVKDEVERLLECFRGVAKGSSVRTVSLLFTFSVPVLNDCVPLLDVYHNCPETVEIVLSLLLDVVESQLAYLSKVCSVDIVCADITTELQTDWNNTSSFQASRLNEADVGAAMLVKNMRGKRLF